MKKLALTLLTVFLLMHTVSPQIPLRWEYRSRGSVSTDLVVDAGILYFGTSAGYLMGLNSTTGEYIFNYTTSSPIYSTPEFTKDKIFFGSDNGALYALNKSTHDTIWTFLAKDRIRSSPVASNGVVYVGSDDSRLYAIDETNGRQIWSFMAGSSIQAKPYVEGWKIYFGSSDRTAYCIMNLTGGLLWNHSARGYFKNSPVIKDDLIYFTSSDRKVTALDKFTGEEVCNTTLNSTIYGSPVIFRDQVIVADYNQNVYSFDLYLTHMNWKTQLNDSIRLTPFAYDNNIYVASGNNLYALDGRTGEKKWSINASRRIMATPAYYKQVLYMADGYYVRAFGGNANLLLNGLRINPRVPDPFTRSQVGFNVVNDGDTIAGGAKVVLYVDGENVSEKTVDVPAKTMQRITYNVTLSSGRHLVEAVVDPLDYIIEADEENNSLGEIVVVSDPWYMSQKDYKRTGFIGKRDSFTTQNITERWVCRDIDTQAYLRGLDFIHNSTLDTQDALKSLDVECFSSERFGAKTIRHQANWSCSLTNYTAYTIDEIIDISKILSSEEGDDWAESRVEELNITNFNLKYSCNVTTGIDIPVLNPMLVYNCRKNYYIEYADVNLSQYWSCYAMSYTNYSIENLARYKGYDTKEMEGQEVAELAILSKVSLDGKNPTSPVLISMDNDPGGLMDVLVATEDGNVYTLNAFGGIRWKRKLSHKIYALTVADLESDGRKDIIMSTEEGVLALNSEGNDIFEYDAGSPVRMEPLVYDIDNTPEKEIVFGTAGKQVIAVNHRGKFLWSHKALDSVESTMSLTDIDLDGQKEIIVGSKDNILYGLNTPPYKVWTFQTNSDIDGAPTIIPYRGDYESIIAATGDGQVYSVYETFAGEEDAQRVCGPEGCTREGVGKTRLISRWDSQVCDSITSSPAAADLDEDGDTDIILGCKDKNMYTLNSTGHRKIRYTTNGPISSSPLVADLDNDKKYEIILASEDSNIYILDEKGVVQQTLELDSKIKATPAIADIDADRYLDLVATSSDGTLYIIGKPRPVQYQSTTMAPTTTTTNAPTVTSTTVLSTTTTTTIKKRMEAVTQFKPNMTYLAVLGLLLLGLVVLIERRARR